MLRIAFVIALGFALSCGQQYHSNPQTAAILSEQRYLAGGKFGSQYSQEDGINFKEETDSDGTRHGSYSYIDPSGERKTVSYTAGKNGFQASGDHIPAPPPAPPQQINPGGQAVPSYRSNNDGHDDGSYDPRYNDPNFSLNNEPVQNRNNQYQPPAQPSPPVQANPPPQRLQYSQPSYQAPVNNYQPTTTITPRIYPPGKLSLNRTPDGFSYSFNKI